MRALPDEIVISKLALNTRLGVTGAERSVPQSVTVEITMEPRIWFSAMADDIRQTVDYHAVATRLVAWTAQQEFNLIETLGEEIASLILKEFPVARVRLELRKYVLPDTDYVAVRLERPR